MGCRAVTHVVEVIITRDAEFSFPDSSSNVSGFNQTSSIDTRHVLSLGHKMYEQHNALAKKCKTHNSC